MSNLMNIPSNPTRHIDGIIPAYVAFDVIRRNPGRISSSMLDTLRLTEELAIAGQTPTSGHQRLLAGGIGERKIYDAQHLQRLPGVRARFEGDAVNGDEIVDRAYEYHGDVRTFYSDVLNRNSLDGKGFNLVGSVHLGRNYNNAYWNDVQMAYGDGDGIIFKTFVLLSVVGHEMSHGLTSFTSNLEYWGQSGALNESFSDVIGVLVEQYKLRQTAKQASWLIGEGLLADGINGVALRSMLEPGTAYNDPKLGRDRQPGHMKDLYKGSGDNGGVHINRGIPNRAFALFAREAGRYAWQKPLDIWYATNCGENRVGEKADFAEFAAKTVENCRALGYDTLVSKLVAAWDAVGIDVSAAATAA